MKDTDVHIKGIGILPENRMKSEIVKRIKAALEYIEREEYNSGHYLLYRNGVIDAYLKAAINHFEDPKGFNEPNFDTSLKSILGNNGNPKKD